MNLITACDIQGKAVSYVIGGIEDATIKRYYATITAEKRSFSNNCQKPEYAESVNDWVTSKRIIEECRPTLEIK